MAQCCIEKKWTGIAEEHIRNILAARQRQVVDAVGKSVLHTAAVAAALAPAVVRKWTGTVVREKVHMMRLGSQIGEYEAQRHRWTVHKSGQDPAQMDDARR
jgi:hypothetical protein